MLGSSSFHSFAFFHSTHNVSPFSGSRKNLFSSFFISEEFSDSKISLLLPTRGWKTIRNQFLFLWRMGEREIESGLVNSRQREKKVFSIQDICSASFLSPDVRKSLFTVAILAVVGKFFALSTFFSCAEDFSHQNPDAQRQKVQMKSK